MEGRLWQGAFFQCPRTVKDYMHTVEYAHLNPVRRGLARRREEYEWSSFREYAAFDAAEQARRCGLKIDRVPLSAD